MSNTGAKSGLGKPDQGTARTYFLNGQDVAVRQLAAGLYLVATPIGNLGDISLRALETLAGADTIACEDTRVTGKLLERYGIRASLTPYHEHNAAAARPKILERLAAGAAIALVSDAGTPLISDPGYKLVQAAQEAGYAVTAIPGASSVLTALAVSGLPTDRFFFEGFLPAKQAARRERAAVLARIPGTLVMFETGPRLAAALGDLSEMFGGRNAAICRELTKLHEEIRRGTVSELAAHYAQGGETRGEFVIVIAPPNEDEKSASIEDIDAFLRQTLRETSLKDAVAAVAEATGAPRKDIYRRALQLVKDNGEAHD
jgi:16S rRNA (cytidine1402-2'-O)-methyltransferase